MIASGMASTRKINLSMKERLDILKDLEACTPVSTIAKGYNVHPTTIRRIRRNAVKIGAFAEMDNEQKERKRIRRPTYEKLEDHLLQWFVERKMLGDHFSDAVLLEKANEIKETIPSYANFKVSMGWLTRFKRRNGIRLLHAYPGKGSNDRETARTFVDNFNELIEEQCVHPENIYNMDETGLMWKALPTARRTFTDKSQANVGGGCKLRRERITIALCANATGSNKIKPLVVNKYKNPRALKHRFNDLPVFYSSQPHGWMDRNVFKRWFEMNFKPSVRKFQSERRIRGKVVLLLSHCRGQEFSADIRGNEDYEIIHLPANTASLIQPMDQGIVQKTKTIFRYKMMQHASSYPGGVSEFYACYNIGMCITMLDQSWGEVTANNVRNAWKKIIVTRNLVEEIDEVYKPCEFQTIMRNITGEDCSEEQVVDFLSVCENNERRNSNGEEEESDAEEEEVEEEIEAEINMERLTSNGPIEGHAEELEYLFDRLTFYSANAPKHIRIIVDGLKEYFLYER